MPLIMLCRCLEAHSRAAAVATAGEPGSALLVEARRLFVQALPLAPVPVPLGPAHLLLPHLYQPLRMTNQWLSVPPRRQLHVTGHQFCNVWLMQAINDSKEHRDFPIDLSGCLRLIAAVLATDGLFAAAKLLIHQKRHAAVSGRHYTNHSKSQGEEFKRE